MKIAAIFLGSLGDFLPLLGVCRSLLQQSKSIHLRVLTHHQHLIRLNDSPLFTSIAECCETEDRQSDDSQSLVKEDEWLLRDQRDDSEHQLRIRLSSRLSLIGITAPIYWPSHAGGCDRSVSYSAEAEIVLLHRLCHGAQVILFNAYSLHAFHVADALRPPAKSVMLSPGWIPNMGSDSSAGRWLWEQMCNGYSELWRELQRQRPPLWSAQDVCGGWLAPLFSDTHLRMRAALGLMEPPLAIPVRQRSVAMPLLLGLSPLLSPPLPPLPAHVRLTGAWLFPDPDHQVVRHSSLSTFLEQHAQLPPIFVGFGSMPFRSGFATSFRNLFIHVAHRLGRSVILHLPFEVGCLPSRHNFQFSAAGSTSESDSGESGDDCHLSRAVKKPKLSDRSSEAAATTTAFSDAVDESDNLTRWLSAHVLEVSADEYLAHGALLPRCALMVHHGGAGTTHQAALAAVPQLVMPIAFDQPMWASRVSELGVGCSLPFADVADLLDDEFLQSDSESSRTASTASDAQIAASTDQPPHSDSACPLCLHASESGSSDVTGRLESDASSCNMPSFTRALSRLCECIEAALDTECVRRAADLAADLRCIDEASCELAARIVLESLVLKSFQDARP